MATIQEQVRDIWQALNGNGNAGIKDRITRIETNLENHVAFDKNFQADVKTNFRNMRLLLIATAAIASGSPYAKDVIELIRELIIK